VSPLLSGIALGKSNLTPGVNATMAKWIIIDPKTGEALVNQPGNETLDYDNGQQAAATAAAFLINFPDVEVPKPTEEELAAFHKALDRFAQAGDEQSEEEGDDEDEPELSLAELHVVCLEHGVRIRMIREVIEPVI
jgi:hypothetical protein